jgi:hypothetical protein
MNRKFQSALSAAIAVAMAGTAAAHDRWYDWRDNPPDASGPYMGFSLGRMNYSEDGLDSITPLTGQFIVGAPLSRNLALEARLGTGLGRSSTDGYGVEARALYGGYVKGLLPLSPAVSLYGLAGVQGVNLRRNFGAYETHDAGLAFGFGADFGLGGGMHVSIEWQRLASGNNLGYDYDVDQAALAMTWRF